MRTAAYLSAAIVAIGLYLAIAAVLALTPAWVGIGILSIAMAASIAIMAGGQAQRRSGA